MISKIKSKLRHSAGSEWSARILPDEAAELLDLIEKIEKGEKKKKTDHSDSGNLR